MAKSKQPKSDNANSPVTGRFRDEDYSNKSLKDDSRNVTHRQKPSSLRNDKQSTSSPINVTTEKSIEATDLDEDAPATNRHIRSMFDGFKTKLSMMVRNIVAAVVEEKICDLTKKLSDFQDSIQFLNHHFEQLKSQQASTTEHMEKLQKDNAMLNVTVADLTSRLAIAEQHQRESNVEINGIPEHRNENLTNCIMQLAKTINVSLKEEDFIQVTRVAKTNRDDPRPRLVVAKLRTPRQRDQLLAGVQTYNKSNKENKLNTHHLGIAGTKAPVFVAEHLTPANKRLHAATRQKAKEKGFKFVWVRNGRIYIRKNETCQALTIRSLDNLKNIT
ncbi:hypothetical protein ACJJTC_014421 [Scirpophaga incertulas]